MSSDDCLRCGELVPLVGRLVGRLVGGVVWWVEELADDAFGGVLLRARGSVVARLMPSIGSCGFEVGGVCVDSFGEEVRETLWKWEERW